MRLSRHTLPAGSGRKPGATARVGRFRALLQSAHRSLLTLLVAVLGTILLSTGCQKELETVELEQPRPYLELLDAYRDGALFVEAVLDGELSHIILSDREIHIRAGELVVYDCSKTNRPPIVLIGGQGWMVQGRQTGIPGTKGKTAEESYPVYVYLYEETLHIFVSNGEILSFPNKSEDYYKPQEFTVPKVRITHNSDRIHKSYAIDGNIVIEDPDCHYSKVSSLSSATKIQGRGNSTWDMPKKPFKIKLSEQQKVLGMPANKDWVFLANYSDKSLLRNAVAMKTSEILGMDWTPRYRIVELWINGEYQGVYNLFEKKEVTRNKVNIDLAAGDMYLEIEQSIDAPCYFWTSRCGVPVQFKEPETPPAATQEWVRSFFNEFETALWGKDFKDPEKGYAAYIDVRSFIDNYIIRELAKDIDGNVRKSAFLTLLKSDGKLHFCHVWDFDLSYGNADYFPWDMDGCNGAPNGPYGWWVKDYNTASNKGEGWYNRLFQDPAFVAAVQDRWSEVYPELSRMPEYIDKLVKEMGEAPARNFSKWKILGTYVWPNVKVTGSYEAEISWLKYFYTNRLDWLDNNLYKL